MDTACEQAYLLLLNVITRCWFLHHSVCGHLLTEAVIIPSCNAYFTQLWYLAYCV